MCLSKTTSQKIPKFRHLRRVQIGIIRLVREAGMKLLPMYLPVLLGGLMMGGIWGAAIGFFAPLASYFITLSVGAAMPSLERLPFMMAELLFFGFTAGLFKGKITKIWKAVIAVFAANLCGRCVLVLSSFFAGLLFNFPFDFWNLITQIKMGIYGVVIQLTVVILYVFFSTKNRSEY